MFHGHSGLRGNYQHPDSLYQLGTVAELRGFNTKAEKTVWDALPVLGEIPGLAHMRKGHFVVVLMVRGDIVWIMDPEHGSVVEMRKQDFEAAWSSNVLRVLYR
ncbi:MAG: cysteine peptidase family C39 domain-containing protein [Pseudomonadota bacterium]